MQDFSKRDYFESDDSKLKKAIDASLPNNFKGDDREEIVENIHGVIKRLLGELPRASYRYNGPSHLSDQFNDVAVMFTNIIIEIEGKIVREFINMQTQITLLEHKINWIADAGNIFN